jgi:hypothetical protein
MKNNFLWFQVGVIQEKRTDGLDGNNTAHLTILERQQKCFGILVYLGK